MLPLGYAWADNYVYLLNVDLLIIRRNWLFTLLSGRSLEEMLLS
jgi:hypothetical protein